ncbi:MAG TPA: preprotein translocase subunit YajC, partial [Acidimicrobiales bacterium]|nr:preprotein translocase subunit YajC [Acidimicrobiales bacterium]
MEQLLPLVLLLGIMYFLLIRPQQRRVRDQRSLISSLEVGEDIVTAGGLIGRIIELDEETATVETTPGVVLRFRRVAISGRFSEPGAEPEVIPP